MLRLPFALRLQYPICPYLVIKSYPVFRIYIRVPSIHVVSKNAFCHQCVVRDISFSRYGVSISSFQLNELSVSEISIIPQFRLSSFSISVDKVLLSDTLDLMNGTLAFQREQNEISFLLHADHCTLVQPKQFQFDQLLAGSQPLSCTCSLSVDHLKYIAPRSTIYLNSFSLIASSDQQFSGSCRHIRMNSNLKNVVEVKGIAFQPDFFMASSLFYYYSPSLLDSIIQDTCSIIRFLPKSLCLSTFYHMIASLNQWKNPESDLCNRSFDFPSFRDDKSSIDNPTLSISIPSCTILFSIDVQNCSHGSNRRVIESSDQEQEKDDEDVHYVTLHTSLSSSISSDEWVIRMMNTSISDQDEGEIAMIRASVLTGFTHHHVSFLDIFFSGVSLSFSMSKFATIFRIAQEVTFSVWCAMYDIVEEFCQCSIGKRNDSFCRDRNRFYLDCSWKKFSRASQPSLRNRDYSNRREKEKLLNEWRLTPATDGNQVDRIRCEGLEIRSEEDHWSIQVREWGGNHMPSIEFYFNKVSFRMENNAVIDVQGITLCKRLICDSLLNEFEGEMKESKAIWGVTTGELLQRFEYCGEKLECECWDGRN